MIAKKSKSKILYLELLLENKIQISRWKIKDNQSLFNMACESCLPKIKARKAISGSLLLEKIIHY